MAFKYNIIKAIEDKEAAGIAKGMANAIIELLEELDTVPNHLRDTIMAQTDMDTLKVWLKQAARVNSISAFECFLKENM